MVLMQSVLGRSWIGAIRGSVLLPLGLLVGLWGAFVAMRQSNEDAMLLAFGASALLLAFGAGVPEAEPRSEPRTPQRWSRVVLPLLAAAGVLVGLILLRQALQRFAGPPEGHGTAWILYLEGLGAVFLGFLPWRGTRRVESRPLQRLELAALLAVLAVGSAFRFYRLGTMPYGVWFDEAQNTLEAQRILSEPTYRPVFVPGLSQMPAMTFYYYTLFVNLLGPNIYAVRLATTIMGLAAIVALWALARELFGRRVAILAAAFLAISRWHVDFSRFALAQMFTTDFIPLVLLLFVRSQRRRSPREAVWAGMAVGLGLQFYYAMFTVPLVMALTFLHRFVRGSSRTLWAVVLFAFTLGAAAFTYAPIGQYARDHQAEFNERMRTVSLIQTSSLRETIDLFTQSSPRRTAVLEALRRTTLAHARMFHLEGDHNGRHNLPGEPMLDPVSGLFFAIGLLWCVALVFDERYSMLLLWFGAMISAGILSLDFEAPQGARSFGLTAVVSLMAAVPLARAARAVAGERAGRFRALAAACLVVALLGVATHSSWTTYFDRQSWDPAVWAAFSTPETKIGEVIRAEGADADVYVPPVLLGGPTESLILGHPIEANPFERGRDLPLEPRGRRAIVFFQGNEQETATLLRLYYPGVTLEPFGPPRPDGTSGEPILWIARVPEQDIAAIRGWVTEYSVEGHEPVRQITTSATWNWSRAPLPAPFHVRVRGALRISQDGPYRLVLSSASPAILQLDGESILDSKSQPQSRTVLARGSHRIELEADVTEAAGTMSLGWEGPRTGGEVTIAEKQMFSPRLPVGGLLGSYYLGLDWRGEPQFRQIDPQIAFYFHIIPLPRPFSVRWTGTIYAPSAGVYRFTTTSIDASYLDIDGNPVLANTQLGAQAQGSVTLDSGWHAIEVRYNTLNNYSQVYLNWAPPGREPGLIPTSALRPPGPNGRLLEKDAPAPEEPVLTVGVAAPEPAVVVAAPAAVPAAVDEKSVALTVARSFDSTLPGGLRIARGKDGRLMVLDLSARRAALLNGDGQVLTVLGDAPVASGGFEAPSDVAAGPDGKFYFLDAQGTVQIYSADGRFERGIDLHAAAVYNPRGLFITDRSELLIADTGGGRILVCDGEGKISRQLGRVGHGDGELLDPVDAAIDGSGRIVVVDAGNGRVVRFDSGGVMSSTWTREGANAGPLSPRVDRADDGSVWVAGGEGGDIWKIPDKEGEPVSVFHLPDSAQVAGLAAGSADQLFLLENKTGRVLEARAPGKTGG
jgi:4-amino-4-deoxy-L-arabinose transferase-like glycosyltransferase/sugar lactone lactonase YvrE